MSKLLNNVGLLGTVVILSFAPVLIFQGKEFKATDSRNQTAIEEVKPGYKPWVAPIIKPSGGEIETFLFSAQAAIGSGIVCYILGLYKGRSERKQSAEIVESIENRD